MEFKKAWILLILIHFFILNLNEFVLIYSNMLSDVFHLIKPLKQNPEKYNGGDLRIYKYIYIFFFLGGGTK